VKPAPPPGQYNDMMYLLNNNELTRVQDYDDMWFHAYGHHGWENPDCVYHIGDNPLQRRVWSGSGHLPSFRKSMGILLHRATNTIVTGKERLAAMGWPIYPELAAAAGSHMAVVDDIRRARQFAGNSYHVATVGLLIMVCLGCTRLPGKQ
jgi:hypothetical protein